MKIQEKTPIAVVFYVNQNEDVEGTGYAVYLKDIVPCAYSDSIGIKHDTSADLTALDGNSNTHAMRSTGTSPAAEAVFDIWEYGQSAYIPSVAQLYLLYDTRNKINEYIRKCGGDEILDNPDECWYWTSTEVKQQEKPIKHGCSHLPLEPFKKRRRLKHIKSDPSSHYTTD